MLADGLSQLGHDVILAAPEGSTAPNHNVRVVPNVSRNEMYNEMAIPRNLEKVIEEFKPNIINDMSHSKQLYYMAREKGWNYIPTAHNLTIPQFPESQICLTTLSDRHRRWIYETTGVNSRFVHNGLDVSKFKIIGKKHRSNRLIYVARPNPEKGQLQAIDFALKYKIPCDFICGAIPGDGKTYLLEIARAALFRSCAVYHGEKSTEEKNEMVARAKAMLFLPQVHEAFGLNVIECQLSGVPFIGNDNGALPELVEEGVTGFIIPVEKDEEGEIRYSPSPRGWMTVTMDEKKILEAIDKVSDLDPFTIRRKAVDRFSHIKMAEGYVTIYKAYLDGQRW